jgi:hypothetical protein
MGQALLVGTDFILTLDDQYTAWFQDTKGFS